MRLRLAKLASFVFIFLICFWLSWVIVTVVLQEKTNYKPIDQKQDSSMSRYQLHEDNAQKKKIHSQPEKMNVVMIKSKELLEEDDNSDDISAYTFVAVQNGSNYHLKRKYGEFSNSCINLHDKIQDLFCMTTLPYLEEVKNPCWYEINNTGNGTDLKLRCLPYFHVLGCAKCATTDLYDRLVHHPLIQPNKGVLKKEALWWSWSRYGITNWGTKNEMIFEEYTSLFDNTAEKIASSMKMNSKLQRKIITGDGSPPDFWDFRAWPLIAQNKGLKEPKILTPHLMKHVYRKPKFILLLRNPTDRLYSDYFFTGYGDNPYSFHEDVISSIWTIDNCLMNHTIQHCFFSGEVFAKLKSRIHYGCYVVYLKEWFKVFERSDFYIARTEDYSQDVDIYLAEIFEFLDVYPLSELKLLKIEAGKKKRITKSKAKADTMQRKTRKILDKFYATCNKQLASVLDNNKYLWTEFSSVLKKLKHGHISNLHVQEN